MEIAGGGLKTIEVGIRGSRGMIFSIAPEQVRAYIDLSQAQPGQNYFRLTLDNIRTPLGTEITKINPASVRLTLEIVKSRPVPIKVHFVGKLPSPWHLKSYSIDPPFILVQGPESALAKVRAVFTEPVDLSAIRECTRISVGVEVSPPQLRLAPEQSSRVILNVKVEQAT
jgi:YbbR domain-containing protein